MLRHLITVCAVLLAVGCGDNFPGPQYADLCSDPSVPDGTSCDDGNDCTQRDVCRAGTCAGIAYTCPAPEGSDDCRVGVCNGDGTCSAGNVPDGKACCGSIPADLCDETVNGTCSGGTCARLAAGATTLDAPRALDATGGSPIVAALPGKSGAAVVYTIGTEVWATVQAY